MDELEMSEEEKKNKFINFHGCKKFLRALVDRGVLFSSLLHSF